MSTGGNEGDFTDLAPAEDELHAGDGERDPVDARILWLARERLERIASTNAGWDTLFRDPRDGRLWELTFPQGNLFGGGPRRLAVIPELDAREKYGDC